MHLFALLIAAVFSSQFVEPNANPLVDYDPKALPLAELKEAIWPKVTLTFTADLDGTDTWHLALDAAGTLGLVDIGDADIDPKGSDQQYDFTLSAATDASDLWTAGIPAKFYIVVKDVDSAVVASAEMTVGPTFTVGPTSLREYQLTEDNEFTLTEVAGGAVWTTSVSVWWAVCPEAQRVVADLSDATVKGTATPAANGVVTFTLTAAQIASLGALTNNALYFYAGVTNAGAAAANPPAEVTVQIPKFTANKEAVPFDIVDNDKAFSIELTAKAGTLWATTTPVRIVAASAEDPTNLNLTKTVDPVAGHKVTLAITAGEWTTNIGAELITDKLHIWAGIADGFDIDAVAPIRLDIVPDFATSVKKVFSHETTIPALKVIAATDAWDFSKQIKVKILNDTEAATNVGEIKQTGALSGTAGVYPVGDVDLSGKTISGSRLVVYVAVNTGTDLWADVRGPIEIAYAAKQFDLGGYTIEDSKSALTAVITVIPDVPTTDPTNKIKFWIKTAPVTDFEADLPVGEAFEAANGGAGKVYTSTAVEIPLPAGTRLTTDDTLYIYAGYKKATPPTDPFVYYEHHRAITVTEDDGVERFTVDLDTIPAGSEVPTIVITQTVGKAWTTAFVQLSKKNQASPVQATAAALNAVAGVVTLTLTPDMKSFVKALAKDDVLEVAVKPDARSNYYTKKAEITITAGQLIAAVSPVRRTIAQWGEGSTFEVTLADGVTWTADTSAIIISKTTGAVVAADIKKTGPVPGADKKVTVTVTTADVETFGAINAAIPLYFYFSAAGDAKDDQTPVVVPIVANYESLAFDVEPETILPDATTIPTLTIKPNAVAGWAATIDFLVIDCLIEYATESSKYVEGKADQGTADSADVWTATAPVSLAGFAVTAGQTLYVYSKKDEGDNYLDTPDTIAVQTAETPSFTIAPTDMDWAATLTTPIITVTPNAAAAFPTTAGGTFKAIFSYSDKDDIEKAIAVAEGTTAETKVYTIPATDLSAFEIAGDVAKDVVVKINNGKGVMTHTVNFNIKKKADSAAMGVSPLVSLLAALVFLFVKLF